MLNKLYKKAKRRNLNTFELLLLVFIAICFKLIDTFYYMPHIKFLNWRTQRLKRKIAQRKKTE